MNSAPSMLPLSPAEFDKLATFQAASGTSAMSLEAIDGYFCALLCGPQAIPPSEYLPAIWGEDFVFESPEQLEDILALLTRHWNHVADSLRGAEDRESAYDPLLRPDAAGVLRGNAWAAGFMRGVRQRPGTWRELMLDPKEVGWLTPVLALTHEDSPNPDLRSPLLAADKRGKLLALMAAGLPHIYRYFAAHRERFAATTKAGAEARQMPVINTIDKPGRNDPCSCGSGKKFKHCCLH